MSYHHSPPRVTPAGPSLSALPYLAHGHRIRLALIVPDAVTLPLNEALATSHTVVVAVTL